MNPTFQQWKTKFATLDEMFRAREFRERMMIVGMAVAFLFFVVDTTLLQPISLERGRVALGLERTRAGLVDLQREANRLANTELSDEEHQVAEELEQLRRQLAEIDSRMGSELADLIPPRAIVSVLEELLAEDRDLKLISLHSQPPERIGTNSENSDVDLDFGLYRHGLRIEIEGNFYATLKYLQRLEHSKWNLLWDRFEYRVQKFPTAMVTIDLHTLSEREEWVGV